MGTWMAIKYLDLDFFSIFSLLNFRIFISNWQDLAGILLDRNSNILDSKQDILYLVAGNTGICWWKVLNSGLWNVKFFCFSINFGYDFTLIWWQYVGCSLPHFAILTLDCWYIFIIFTNIFPTYRTMGYICA